MTVGKLLKQLRKEKHISQKILGQRMELTESRISKIEHDIADNIGLRTIEAYLSAIDVKPLEFFTRLYGE